MKFVIYEDKAGEWRWRLRAGNNRLVADSGEGYKTQAGCRRAVERLRQEPLIYSRVVNK